MNAAEDVQGVDWRRAVRLSTVELDVCWEVLGLGDQPPELALVSPGRDAGERRRVIAGVLAELTRRGLAGGARPGPLLAGLLRLLARPAYQVDIRLAAPRLGGRTGLGAVAGANGVLVAQQDDQLALLPVDGSRVPAAMAGMAGALSPGIGRPVNIAAEVYDAAHAATPDRSLWTMADQLVARGVEPVDAHSLARMADGAGTVGQLGVTAWVEGLPQRAPWVVAFFQAKAGHFLLMRRGGSVTVAPADTSRLHAKVRELVDVVRR